MVGRSLSEDERSAELLAVVRGLQAFFSSHGREAVFPDLSDKLVYGDYNVAGARGHQLLETVTAEINACAHIKSGSWPFKKPESVRRNYVGKIGANVGREDEAAFEAYARALEQTRPEAASGSAPLMQRPAEEAADMAVDASPAPLGERPATAHNAGASAASAEAGCTEAGAAAVAAWKAAAVAAESTAVAALDAAEEAAAARGTFIEEEWAAAQAQAQAAGAQAVRLWGLAAARGDADAQFGLALLLSPGGTLSTGGTLISHGYVNLDYVAAERLCGLAAAQGHAQAQFDMYGCFWQKDRAEARRWLGLAVAQGCAGTWLPTEPRYLSSLAEAQRALALILYEGLGGPKDHAEARRLWGLVASPDDGRDLRDSCYGEAHKFLGLMCQRGEGGPSDEDEALRHFDLAVARFSYSGDLGLQFERARAAAANIRDARVRGGLESMEE